MMKNKSMEVTKKPSKQQLSVVVNGGGFRGKRSVADGGDSHRNCSEPTDHWDFLEEIDAPMWVDLALESMSKDQNINANWFEQVHPFHQLSSYHFFGEEKLEADSLGLSSPMIPSSVSKSRGKHYRSRKWRADNNAASVSKKHPIKSFGAQVSRSFQGTKAKFKVNSGNPKPSYKSQGKLYSGGIAGCAIRPNSLKRNARLQNLKITSNLKASFDDEGTSGESRDSKASRPKSCLGDSKNYSSFTASLSSNSTSTISSIPDACKHKLSLVNSRTSHTITSNAPQSKTSIGDSEVTSVMAACFEGSKNSVSLSKSDFHKPKLSFCGLKSSLDSKENSGSGSNTQDSQLYGQSSGLLLAVRASLRTSYVTRQPARVEVKDKAQLKGCKSSSSKSSVGSSTNSGCRFAVHATTRSKNSTPETGKVPMNHKKAEVKNASKTWAGQVHMHRSSSKWKEKSTAGKPVGQEASKLKISYQSEHRKPLRLQNLRYPYTHDPKTKESVRNTNKGEAVGRNVLDQKVGSKENNVGNTLLTRTNSKYTSTAKKKEVFDPKDLYEKKVEKKLTLDAKGRTFRMMVFIGTPTSSRRSFWYVSKSELQYRKMNF